jgi:hypothetical protein
MGILVEFPELHRTLAALSAPGARNCSSLSVADAMKIASVIAVSMLAAGMLFCSPAISCEYSIRDVAFVTYEVEYYRLFIFVDSATSDEVRTALDRVAYTVLLDSNVRFEIVDVDVQKSHPAIEYLSAGALNSGPCAILAAPFSGLAPLTLALPEPGATFREELWSVLESTVVSPRREEIVASVTAALNVVVLFEGADAALNEQARAAAEEAADRIGKMMTLFPKPVHAPAPLDAPPRLVVVPRADVAKEKVLLWSLGLGSGPFDEPRAVVLHGRGRQVGWALAGEKIELMMLGRFLSVSGQDCECTLPREWLRGRLVPLRWEDEVRAALVQSLGFDPDSPLVKSDVSLIAGIRPGAGEFAASGSLPLGYREITVEFGEEGGEKPTDLAAEPAQAAETPAGDAPELTGSVVDHGVQESGGGFQNFILLLGAMALVAMILIVIIVARAKRRDS